MTEHRGEERARKQMLFSRSLAGLHPAEDSEGLLERASELSH